MMPPTETSAALFGWHSQDSRATGPLDTADTVAAHYGTGGGKGALIQTELSATLATNNDQTLFAPVTKE